MRLWPITDRIAIADQPTRDDLEALKRDGYVGIVNLRRDGEPDQPLSTTEEGNLVRDLGMAYHHYGMAGIPPSAEEVEAVCNFIDHHASSGMVLVHCHIGVRALGLALVQQARFHGWKPDEVAARAEARGWRLEGHLRNWVEHVLVLRHRQATESPTT